MRTPSATTATPQLSASLSDAAADFRALGDNGLFGYDGVAHGRAFLNHSTRHQDGIFHLGTLADLNIREQDGLGNVAVDLTASESRVWVTLACLEVKCGGEPVVRP